MMKYLRLILIALTVAVACAPAAARAFNDKLQNRPYADQRKWHLGFSIGAYSSDLHFTHNGFTTESGEQWRIDQPNYQPGFCVNGLFDWRLNNYFSLRVSPGMYFGSRDIRMYNVSDGATERQNIKSTFVVMPLDLKYASLRYRNCRPYVTTGIMPAFDVAKKRSDFIKTKSSDFLSVIRIRL